MEEKKYINESKLLEKLARMIDYCKTDNKVDGLTALFQVGDAIMDCPAEDVVEVVRCKDCVNSCFFERCTNGICDRNGKRAINKDDFCSYGERR